MKAVFSTCSYLVFLLLGAILDTTDFCSQFLSQAIGFYDITGLLGLDDSASQEGESEGETAAVD